MNGVSFCLALVCIAQVSSLPDGLKEQISAHEADVKSIIEYVRKGAGKHQAYNRLANFTDTFGPRVSGSQALEDSIDYMLQKLEDEGFTNVAGETARAPDWRRGEEWAMMLTPRTQLFQIMALGSSVGTEGETLTAEVIVVDSFEELEAKDNLDIEGKIVVYNQGWNEYSHGYVYRNDGARRAAAKGAVASLIQSVAPFSLYTPHTGQQNYGDANNSIPTACITIEDSQLMKRLQDAGENITVSIYMEATNLNDTTSRNVVAELAGDDTPGETVVIGGHIDSWDVGMGVMDDAGGVIISWQAISILKALGLTPKRTIRVVFWTSEEEGLIGAEDYFEAHKDEVNTTSIVMESDAGTFTPLGVGFSGSGLAKAIMEEIMSMLHPINASGVTDPGTSPDTGVWHDAGVPVGNLWNRNEKYFYYHHTHADTLTLADPDVLDLCAITWATAAYVVANLDEMLPRVGEYPDVPPPADAAALTASTPIVLLSSLLLTRLYTRF